MWPHSTVVGLMTALMKYATLSMEIIVLFLQCARYAHYGMHYQYEEEDVVLLLLW